MPRRTDRVNANIRGARRGESLTLQFCVKCLIYYEGVAALTVSIVVLKVSPVCDENKGCTCDIYYCTF